jgi:hypothetical protein
MFVDKLNQPDANERHLGVLMDWYKIFVDISINRTMVIIHASH